MDSPVAAALFGDSSDFPNECILNFERSTLSLRRIELGAWIRYVAVALNFTMGILNLRTEMRTQVAVVRAWDPGGARGGGGKQENKSKRRRARKAKKRGSKEAKQERN